jgi:hypothetical protein
MAYTILAQHSGTCTCGKYVRAGTSTISPVDVPMPPDPAVCLYSGERGCWYIGGASSPSHVRSRRWLHERCAARLDRLSFDDLEQLAADRRVALSTMKKRGDAEYGRRVGRQRRARSKASRPCEQEAS